MERIELEELKAHLMATNEEYRGLASQHSEFAHKLDELEALPHLTDQEQLEEVRLKKLKLRLKDQMEAIVSQSRSQTGRLTSGARSNGNCVVFPARSRLRGRVFIFVHMQPEDDEPIRIPITDVFDLHTVPPRDVRAVVEEYLH